jgi:glutamine amidotransferase
MCELFAISSKVPTKVTFSLDEFSRHGGQTARHRDGWGLAFYDGVYAQIFRDTEPSAGSEWMHFLRQHQHLSQCVISHIRYATVGEIALRNTQPFSRELGGQRHTFCHNGELKNIDNQFKLKRHKPIGETDSEYAFCYLLSELETLWHKGPPSLKKRIKVIDKVFKQFSELGAANFLYCDGNFLYAFANKRTQANGMLEPPGMYYLTRNCHCDPDAESLSGVELTSRPVASVQNITLFASVPLSNEAWQPLKSNQLIVTQNGSVIDSETSVSDF